MKTMKTMKAPAKPKAIPKRPMPKTLSQHHKVTEKPGKMSNPLTGRHKVRP